MAGMFTTLPIKDWLITGLIENGFTFYGNGS
jgi:hypothetical protein